MTNDRAVVRIYLSYLIVVGFTILPSNLSLFLSLILSLSLFAIYIALLFPIAGDDREIRSDV